MTATKANYIWAWVIATIVTQALAFIATFALGYIAGPLLIGVPSGVELLLSISMCLWAFVYYLCFVTVYRRFSYLNFRKAVPYISVLGVVYSVFSFLTTYATQDFGVALITLLALILATIFIGVKLTELQEVKHNLAT